MLFKVLEVKGWYRGNTLHCICVCSSPEPQSGWPKHIWVLCIFLLSSLCNLCQWHWCSQQLKQTSTSPQFQILASQLGLHHESCRKQDVSISSPELNFIVLVLNKVKPIVLCRDTHRFSLLAKGSSNNQHFLTINPRSIFHLYIWVSFAHWVELAIH